MSEIWQDKSPMDDLDLFQKLDVEMCMHIVMVWCRFGQVSSSEVCMVLRVEEKMYCNLNYQSSGALLLLGKLRSMM